MKIYTIEGRDFDKVLFTINVLFPNDESAKEFIREAWEQGYYDHVFSVCLSEGDRPIMQTMKNITI